MEQTATVIAFGPFRLLPSQGRLWEGEEQIELRAMPLAVLTYLAQHPGRVVSAEELRRAVWGRTRVSRTTIRVCMREVRQALGDKATSPCYIETVGRQGYRFTGDHSTSLTTPSSVLSSEFQVSNTESLLLPKPFVGRQRELMQLQQWFAQAQEGRRHVVLVSGEPGIGKTALINQFVAQLPATAAVWIGRGQCVESYGQGEAYLPILEAIGRLGRELGSGTLTAVLQQYAPTWLAQLPALVDIAVREELHRQIAGATQERMLRELCDALEVLTAEQQFILILEDLHWSDTATLAFLAAVARRVELGRLFVLGAYRPIEVIAHLHPLRSVTQELRAHRFCREVRLELLSADEVREYVHQQFASSAVADELGPRLYQRTDGNPLFLTASVEALFQQGIIGKEGERWIVRNDLAAIEDAVPEDLQELIAKQVEELSTEEQQVLAVASVSGMSFTVAGIAAGCTQELEAVEETCERLAQHGQMIEGGVLEERPDGTLTARYGFRHTLYQQVVYGRLGSLQKVRLHRLLGERTEAVYRDQEMAVASKLAMHFARGRKPDKAVRYYQLAAEQSLQRSAYREALSHCQAGLVLLPKLPEAQERLRLELALRLSLSTTLTVAQDFTGDELAHNLQCAWELCEDINDMPHRVAVLVGLTRTHLMRADRAKTEELAEHERRLLAQVQNPTLALRLHAQLATTEMVRGAHARAHQHAAQVLALHVPASHEPILGVDPIINTWGILGWSAWMTGQPVEAVRRVEQGVAFAREAAPPFFSTFSLMYAAHVRLCRGESAVAQALTQQLIMLAHEYGFSLYGVLGSVTLGCIDIQAGRGKEESITLINSGLAKLRAKRFHVYIPFFLPFLAQGYAQLGRLQNALATITEAIHLSETTLAAFWQAEAYRVKGELILLTQTSQRQVVSKSKASQPTSSVHRLEAEAAACFLKAIEIARRQDAKVLELRAAVSLVRLRQRQTTRRASRPMYHITHTRLDEAYEALSEVYHWFTEGFDTKDLQAAKALLEELDHSRSSLVGARE